MSPEQRRLARHALGLPNRYRRSYRNRFLAGGRDENWLGLVEDGLAESGEPDDLGRTWLWLTRAGAEAALEPGERLCREDFPPPPAARDASGRFARRPPQSSTLAPGA
ncbi:hypothetical protein [Methylorubrum zatmanii]|uniref:Uncharacterized protein n=1 Tax=Methylorubrum zatmanii TaxID=29429 RepID=A0ABW1WY73_9HYPH|nr:hypothetical protein [Methylorubrum zatmanii]